MSLISFDDNLNNKIDGLFQAAKTSPGEALLCFMRAFLYAQNHAEQGMLSDTQEPAFAVKAFIGQAKHPQKEHIEKTLQKCAKCVDEFNFSSDTHYSVVCLKYIASLIASHKKNKKITVVGFGEHADYFRAYFSDNNLLDMAKKSFNKDEKKLLADVIAHNKNLQTFKIRGGQLAWLLEQKKTLAIEDVEIIDRENFDEKSFNIPTRAFVKYTADAVKFDYAFVYHFHELESPVSFKQYQQKKANYISDCEAILAPLQKKAKISVQAVFIITLALLILVPFYVTQSFPVYGGLGIMIILVGMLTAGIGVACLIFKFFTYKRRLFLGSEMANPLRLLPIAKSQQD